jgi:hypothetical protein
VITENYLQKARDLKFALEQLEEDRREIISTMTSIKSASDYSDRVQTSPQGDGLERKVIKMIERLEKMDKRINAKVCALTMRRSSIRDKICRMKEGQSRRFLIDYYIYCKSYEQIFREYAIEPDYHLKRKAIREFEKAQKDYRENTDEGSL